jgi:hypothetical protein
LSPWMAHRVHDLDALRSFPGGLIDSINAISSCAR